LSGDPAKVHESDATEFSAPTGYEPVHLGGLDQAATQEHASALLFAIAQDMGPFFYRFAPPGQL
jgi:hypothetical protein